MDSVHRHVYQLLVQHGILSFFPSFSINDIVEVQQSVIVIDAPASGLIPNQRVGMENVGHLLAVVALQRQVPGVKVLQNNRSTTHHSDPVAQRVQIQGAGRPDDGEHRLFFRVIQENTGAGRNVVIGNSTWSLEDSTTPLSPIQTSRGDMSTSPSSIRPPPPPPFSREYVYMNVEERNPLGHAKLFQALQRIGVKANISNIFHAPMPLSINYRFFFSFVVTSRTDSARIDNQIELEKWRRDFKLSSIMEGSKPFFYNRLTEEEVLRAIILSTGGIRGVLRDVINEPVLMWMVLQNRNTVKDIKSQLSKRGKLMMPIVYIGVGAYRESLIVRK